MQLEQMNSLGDRRTARNFYHWDSSNVFRSGPAKNENRNLASIKPLPTRLPKLTPPNKPAPTTEATTSPRRSEKSTTYRFRQTIRQESIFALPSISAPTPFCVALKPRARHDAWYRRCIPSRAPKGADEAQPKLYKHPNPQPSADQTENTPLLHPRNNPTETVSVPNMSKGDDTNTEQSKLRTLHKQFISSLPHMTHLLFSEDVIGTAEDVIAKPPSPPKTPVENIEPVIKDTKTTRKHRSKKHARPEVFFPNQHQESDPNVRNCDLRDPNSSFAYSDVRDYIESNDLLPFSKWSRVYDWLLVADGNPNHLGFDNARNWFDIPSDVDSSHPEPVNDDISESTIGSNSVRGLP